MGVGSYAFSGWITGGTSEVYGTTPVDFVGLCVENPESCISAEYDDVQFVGRWNNGWRSEGDVYAWFSNGGGYQGGFIDMTTYTPEPSSVVLLGSGILGIAGVLRRKFLS